MSEPQTVMLDRCAGCAFRPGTEASTQEFTVMMRDLCVAVGSPFECHDSGAGHLCRGFVDAFVVKLSAGDYDRMPDWKKEVYHALLDVLHDFREASVRGEPMSDAAIKEAVANAALAGCALPPHEGSEVCP